LKKHGYRCRHIAQEHSYVKTMWRVITNPDALIFLECSFENSTSRRKLNWLPEDTKNSYAGSRMPIKTPISS